MKKVVVEKQEESEDAGKNARGLGTTVNSGCWLDVIGVDVEVSVGIVDVVKFLVVVVEEKIRSLLKRSR